MWCFGELQLSALGLGRDWADSASIPFPRPHPSSRRTLGIPKLPEQHSELLPLCLPPSLRLLRLHLLNNNNITRLRNSNLFPQELLSLISLICRRARLLLLLSRDRKPQWPRACFVEFGDVCAQISALLRSSCVDFSMWFSLCKQG